MEKIHISNDEELQELINRFCNGPTFAAAFEFDSDELWEGFLNAIGLDLDSFNEKYFYYDKNKEIHISESSEGYIWISTIGLVAKTRVTDNKYINTCGWQKDILIYLLGEAIALSKDERTYDVDGYNYSKVKELTPALFHNTIFYFETLAKAYLSVNGQDVPKTHKLDELFDLVKCTMFKKHHNNTLFHAHTIPIFEGVVKHIAAIPGSFKEQYVKYDDNPQDTTFVVFHPDHLEEMQNLVKITWDMVADMYYDKESLYLGKDLYQRLLDECTDEEARKRLKDVYGFLLEEQ